MRRVLAQALRWPARIEFPASARRSFASRAKHDDAKDETSTSSANLASAWDVMESAMTNGSPHAGKNGDTAAVAAVQGALNRALEQVAGGAAHKPQTASKDGKPLKKLKLQDVTGVGPKNETLLRSSGVDSVLKLAHIYHSDEIGARRKAFVEYLMDEVNIRYQHHAQQIAGYVEGLRVDEDEDALKAAASAAMFERDERVTFCVEGNIAVGKTTFLQKVVQDRACVTLTELVDIVPEPVGEWSAVQGVEFDPENMALTRPKAETFNLLDAFYAQPERFAYTFQNYVFVTRMLQNQRSAENWQNPIRLLERSVFSDRMVFVRAVHEAKWMSELELAVYESWFAPVVSAMPGLIPDGFIYLRAEPSTCFDRKNVRSRMEEDGVDLEYLTQLHEKHEQWLYTGDGNSPHMIRGGKATQHAFASKSLLGGLTGEDEVPELIRGKMRYLSAKSHPLCAGVPTLVLDYDPQLDLDHDVEAKKEYAAQVKCFYEHVRKMKRRVVVPASSEQVKELGRKRTAL